jgi:hypothetical protein
MIRTLGWHFEWNNYLIFDINGHRSTRLYDKGDDSNFAIINITHLDSNIPTATAYKFIFHKSCTPLEFTRCIQTFSQYSSQLAPQASYSMFWLLKDSMSIGGPIFSRMVLTIFGHVLLYSITIFGWFFFVA